MKDASAEPGYSEMLTELITQMKLPLKVDLIAKELINLRTLLDRWFLRKKRPPYTRKVSLRDVESLLEKIERVDQMIEQAWKIAKATENPDVKTIEELLTTARNELRVLPLPD